DRGPRADGLEVHHECECLPREVVATACAGEPELAARNLRHLQRLVDHREEELDLGRLRLTFVARLRVADDRDFLEGFGCGHHHTLSLKFSAGRSGSPVGLNPSSEPSSALPERLPTSSTLRFFLAAHTAATRIPARTSSV